ncbi:hypothetical protein KSP40_PGU013313 [Platanthera guangdongensis]|uniref:Rit1 N-terminal domain-containing protein n=1 Tax=Platanthera guangdongensis TaxID=2320717 RepID=A0ABR2MY33_9ASPA
MTNLMKDNSVKTVIWLNELPEYDSSNFTLIILVSASASHGKIQLRSTSEYSWHYIPGAADYEENRARGNILTGCRKSEWQQELLWAVGSLASCRNSKPPAKWQVRLAAFLDDRRKEANCKNCE